MKKLNPFGVLIEGYGKSLSTVPLDDLRAIFEREHLVVLRGFKKLNDDKEFLSFAESFGEVSVWPFGKILNLVQQEKPEDHIFDNSYIPMHWDGMYREEVPEMQVFYCKQAPNHTEGGRTIFTNTKKILEDLNIVTKKRWEKIRFSYQRKMEFYDSKTSAPLICKHQEKDFSVLRFCEPPKKSDTQFKNHPGFEIHGGNENDLNYLRELLYDGKYLLSHQWMTGDLVLADNFTLLHGREEFRSGSARHLQRVQILGQERIPNPHLEYTR